MFRWNDTFRSEKTQYFTLLPLQKFAKINKRDYLKPQMDRKSIIDGIEQFANENQENEEMVKKWIDRSMREGRRELYIAKFDNNMVSYSNLQSDEFVNTNLCRKLLNRNNRHILDNVYNSEYSLIDYDIYQGTFGRIISMVLCKYIYCTNDEKNRDGLSLQIYPVVVDVLADMGYIVARVKTKANMFKHTQDVDSVKNLTTTNTEREALNAFGVICRYLQIDWEKEKVDDLKRNLYLLLDKCTHTPPEIQIKLDNNSDYIESLTNTVVGNICQLGEEFRKDVMWDITNMIEKYFSVTYADKTIFTKNRIAYPIKLNATDQQFSKVQQTAGFEEPLQAKDIFFDNKKMLQMNQRCDGIRLSYMRKDSTYCSDRFSVQINVKNRVCIIKFFDYTLEEDIENVLFSIIGNQRDNG